MSTIGALVLFTALGVGGVALAWTGWQQPAPSLSRALVHLQRTTPAPRATQHAQRLAPHLGNAIRAHPRLLPSEADLKILRRSVEQHAVALVAASTIGFVLPPLVLTGLRWAGLVELGWFVPVIVAIGGAALGPVLVHTTTIERAQAVRSDLRYQVSAYLDVVTMLLAGNTGYESALEQAAHAGDGRLFSELRRRMRESGARGTSLTEALARTGRDLGLDELEQVAATAALSAAEGAPVARTLAAKCATLRSALATEQESEARLRTSRLTTPIVGMALIFMALVIYPALSFS